MFQPARRHSWPFANKYDFHKLLLRASSSRLRTTNKQLTSARFEGALRDTTDFTINLGHCAWRLHLELLAQHSDFFKAIRDREDWKVRSAAILDVYHHGSLILGAQESNEHTVTLQDDDVYLFARALQYIHYFIYQPDSNMRPRSEVNTPTVTEIVMSGYRRRATTTPDHEDMQFYAAVADSKRTHALIDLGVYSLADKYNMTLLRGFALQRFRSHALGLETLTDVIERTFEDFPNIQDKNVKKAVAEKIAKVYKEARKGENNEQLGVQGWLQRDSELCLLVMDAMSQ